jgi:hypothetical protein
LLAIEKGRILDGTRWAFAREESDQKPTRSAIESSY